MYGGMVLSVILLSIIGPIFFRQKVAESGAIRDSVLRILLGVSLGASALGLLLRRRVPRRIASESTDLFWTTAASPALVAWTPIEGAGLIAAIAFSLSGSLAALAIGGVALVLLLVLNPGYLERP